MTAPVARRICRPAQQLDVPLPGGGCGDRGRSGRRAWPRPPQGRRTGAAARCCSARVWGPRSISTARRREAGDALRVREQEASADGSCSRSRDPAGARGADAGAAHPLLAARARPAVRWRGCPSSPTRRALAPRRRRRPAAHDLPARRLARARARRRRAHATGDAIGAALELSGGEPARVARAGSTTAERARGRAARRRSSRSPPATSGDLRLRAQRCARRQRGPPRRAAGRTSTPPASARSRADPARGRSGPNDRTTNWTIGPCPTEGWATMVHPQLDPAEALAKLWEQMAQVLARPRAWTCSRRHRAAQRDLLGG